MTARIPPPRDRSDTTVVFAGDWHERLHAAGFLLDQKPLLDAIDLTNNCTSARSDTNPPPLAEYRTFQVPVSEIAQLTGLNLEALAHADVHVPIPAARPDSTPRARWVELTDPTRIVL